MARVLAITVNPALDLSIGIDRLTPGEVNRACAGRTNPAGKGHNVARVLAAHDHAVTVSGFLGTNNAGVFASAFAEWGVADACVRVAGETRTNVKLAEAGGRVTDVNVSGQPVREVDVRRLAGAIETALAGPLDAVVVAGSLPPGLTGAMLRDVLTPVARAGVPLWLDASGAALTAGLALAPGLIKPNDAELAAWAGRELVDTAGLVATGRELQARGAGEIAISRGAAGVLWLASAGGLAARAPTVNVVSTVAAGDTLVAGLLHGRLSGWVDAETLAFAVALSADAVTRVGVGRSDTPDFETLRRAVAIEMVDSRASVD